MRAGLAALLLLAGAAWSQSAPPAAPPTTPEQASAALASAKTEEYSILTALSESDAALRGLREEVAALQQDTDVLAAQRAERQHDLDLAAANLESRRADSASRVRALYRIQRRGLVGALFSAESPDNLRRRAQYLRHLLDAELARMAEFGNLVERRKEAVAALEQSGAALDDSHARLAAREAALLQERGARLAMLDDVRTRRELALAALAQMSAAQHNLQQSLTRPSVDIGPTSFRAAYGKLPWPASGRVLRRFGAGANADLGLLGESLGLDLRTAPGTAFHAVFDGVVRLAGDVAGYGTCVALEHGSYTTVYAHAASLRVSRGQSVRAGDTLGVAGDSGLADPDCCTLTFELRYNGTPQDPMPWLLRSP